MKITIEKPCHENWETMTVKEKGRFCSVCSKTVRDFTNDSDDEIITAFSNSTEEICGNFYEFQLNRNLQYSFINSFFSKFAVGFILTAVGIVSLNAQEKDFVKTSILANLQGKLISVLPNPENTSVQQYRRIGAPTSIQGSNEPLWVVDGEIIDAKAFKDFETEKIKKMQVLKGLQATTLYGSKGRNGVILITMKKRFRNKK